LWSRTTKQASNSSIDHGGGKRRSAIEIEIANANYEGGGKRRAGMTRSDSKAAGMRPTGGFAYIPQDRAVPPFPQHGIGRVVELGSFGGSQARLGKVTLVERFFCDVASSGLA
jgi:hypothetical protein